jgi:hypothetical protein
MTLIPALLGTEQTTLVPFRELEQRLDRAGDPLNSHS